LCLTPASLGRSNEFGHPHPETLALLAAYGEDITRYVITDYTPLSEAPETLVRLAGSRHDGLQLVFN